PRIWNEATQFVADGDRHDCVMLAPDEQRRRADRAKVAPDLVLEQIARGSQQRDRSGAQRVVAERGHEAWRELACFLQKWAEAGQERATNEPDSRSGKREAIHQAGTLHGDAQTDLPAHRVADEMRWPNVDGLHPADKPVSRRVNTLAQR